MRKKTRLQPRRNIKQNRGQYIQKEGKKKERKKPKEKKNKQNKKAPRCGKNKTRQKPNEPVHEITKKAKPMKKGVRVRIDGASIDT